MSSRPAKNQKRGAETQQPGIKSPQPEDETAVEAGAGDVLRAAATFTDSTTASDQ